MDITYYKKYEPIFGEWSIVREIGEGSFGKVFEIERRDFGYTYKAALKAITIPQSRSEIERIADDGMGLESVTAYFRGFVQELVEEFRIMSKLKGESNIVSYEDHRVIEHTDEIGWDVLIRMELLTPLTKYAKEYGISRADVIRLGIDICSALELCRKNNIIHRDIKPENIFVSENGKFKLGDFGIAKTVEKTTGGLSKKGTYTYMAPEVYKGESYGASVDIYSLGIVLYRFMNNNRTPFLPPYPTPIKYADRESAMARRIKGETLPAPANADNELAAIILKACAYNPKDRYSSPAEMREALEALLYGRAYSGARYASAEDITAEDTAVKKTVKEEPAKGQIADKTVSIFSKKEDEAPVKAANSGFASNLQTSAVIRESADNMQPDIDEYQDDSLDCTVSMFNSGSKTPKASPKSIINAEGEKKKAAAVATKILEKRKDGVRTARENKGNWYIEREYNANDVVVVETGYTSLGNRFRETQYDDDGNRISESLFDYLDRERKLTIFNADGTVKECVEYEY